MVTLKNRLAKLLIDPTFRHPGLLKVVFSIDDVTGIDLVKTLAPFRLMPASRKLFSRCFAHFVSGEEISLAASTQLAALAPDRAAHDYLLVQAGEERRHLDHFCDKLSAFGLGETELERFLAPSFTAFGAAISERIERGDYVAGIIGNNIVVEGLAICLLELGCGDMRANSDEIAAFMDFVLEDERHHVRFGERMLKRMNERDQIDRAAAEDFYGIMWQLVHKAIHEIPDVLDAMGLVPATLERDVKTYYDRRFAAAGLTFAV
jgi:rubrerythrin